MKFPQRPPDFQTLVQENPDFLKRGREIDAVLNKIAGSKYLHWDKLRHLPLPEGWTHGALWLRLSLQRSSAAKQLPLRDKQGEPFTYSVPDSVAMQLHEIDIGAGGAIGMPEQMTNPQTRDQYVVRSLMEEAITSSQLEGAVTTRQEAKEMLRSGRPPRDRSERMILNNFETMQAIMEFRGKPLTRELVFDIHRRVTAGTLDDESATGRFRRAEENITVQDESGTVFHEPPKAEELDSRMNAMCAFANGETPEQFVHPVLRAIILHFWLAYDHPFVDGNGRTARALFYWAMMRHSYWLFEFISISEILLNAPAKYARAFLYTETDGNDLTYFIIHQAEVIRRAVKALHAYIGQKAAELSETEGLLRNSAHLNHRQEALLVHALRHPGLRYTVQGHRLSHAVAYDTARNDLLGLHRLDLLDMKKSGKSFIFFAKTDLSERICGGSEGSA